MKSWKSQSETKSKIIPLFLAVYLFKYPGEKPRDISHSNKPVINTDPEAVDTSVKYFQLFIAPA